MSKNMSKLLTAILLLFYIAIIMYILFGIVHVNELENFVAALIFEIMCFILLTFVIFCNSGSNKIKVGFYIPLIMTTVFYVILVNVINILLVATISQVWFLLINLVVLFVYCLITVPMLIAGSRED